MKGCVVCACVMEGGGHFECGGMRIERNGTEFGSHVL